VNLLKASVAVLPTEADLRSVKNPWSVSERWNLGQAVIVSTPNVIVVGGESLIL